MDGENISMFLFFFKQKFIEILKIQTHVIHVNNFTNTINLPEKDKKIVSSKNYSSLSTA